MPNETTSKIRYDPFMPITRQLQMASLSTLLDLDRGVRTTSENAVRWFASDCDRKTSETLLLNAYERNKQDGIFLIRTCSKSPKDFSVSTVYHSDVYHYRMTNYGDCYFTADDGRIFFGLDKAIQYFRDHKELAWYLTEAVDECHPIPLWTRSSGIITLLHKASSHGDIDILDKILKNQYRGDVDERDPSGSTALHIACSFGHDEIVERLLEAGASPAKNDSNGRTPLHRAVEENHPSTALLLIDWGAEINAVDKHKSTPLHEAAKNNSFACVSALLQCRAPLRPRDNDDKTPLELAIECGARESAKILNSYKVPVNELDSQLWFHPSCSKESAKKMFQLSGNTDGLFLVRFSEVKGCYVLSMVAKSDLFNYEICKDQNGFFSISDGPLFSSLSELVDHYMHFQDRLFSQLKAPVKYIEKNTTYSQDTVSTNGHDNNMKHHHSELFESSRAVMGARNRIYSAGSPVVPEKDTVEKSVYRPSSSKTPSHGGRSIESSRVVVGARHRNDNSTRSSTVPGRGTVDKGVYRPSSKPPSNASNKLISLARRKSEQLARLGHSQIITTTTTATNDSSQSPPLDYLSKSQDFHGEHFMSDSDRSGGKSPLYKPDKSVKFGAQKVRPLEAIKLKQIEFIKKIGEGEFGIVYEGSFCREENSPPISVAIKALKHMSSEAIADFKREAKIMGELGHHCIVKIYGIVEENNELLMVQELVNHGSVLNMLRRNPDKITVNHLKKWAMQIANALSYMESKKFVHRDLSARNVLIATFNQVKVCDFGLSRSTVDDIYNAQNEGKIPVKWYAVEAIEQGRFSSKSDVWSYGVTLWEMFTYGKEPYGKMTGAEVYEFIKNDNKLDKPALCPESTYKIMCSCWDLDENKRPTFKSLVKYFDEDAQFKGLHHIIRTGG